MGYQHPEPASEGKGLRVAFQIPWKAGDDATQLSKAWLCQGTKLSDTPGRSRWGPQFFFPRKLPDSVA